MMLSEDSAYESISIELQTPMVPQLKYTGSDPEQASEKTDLLLLEPSQYEQPCPVDQRRDDYQQDNAHQSTRHLRSPNNNNHPHDRRRDNTFQYESRINIEYKIFG